MNYTIFLMILNAGLCMLLIWFKFYYHIHVVLIVYFVVVDHSNNVKNLDIRVCFNILKKYILSF